MTRHVILFRDSRETPEDVGSTSPGSPPPSPFFCLSTQSSPPFPLSSHSPPPLPLLPLPSSFGDRDPYESRLSSAGFSATSIPVLTYDFVNLQQLRNELERVDKYRGLILTSPRAVEAVEIALKSISHDDVDPANDGLKNDVWSRLPIFVVGSSTQRCAESRLGKILGDECFSSSSFSSSSPSPSSTSPSSTSPSSTSLRVLGAESNNAKNLAEFVVSFFASDLENEGTQVRLLYPASNIRSSLLQERLERANIRVDSISAYQTETHPHVESNLDEWMRRRLKEEESKNEKKRAETSSASDIDPSSPLLEFSSLPSAPLPPTSSLPSLHPHLLPDACVFFSPSGVKSASSSFAALLWPVDEMLVVAVGPTTLKAVEGRGFRRKAMAVKPTAEEVVNAILRELSSGAVRGD